MRSFWSDPYLWIHLAGGATVPLWLELCWLGLAVGDPVLPYWLELLTVGAIGIVPILWMQWQRPFDIYGLMLLAVRLDQLTPQQRQVLTRFTAPRNRLLAIATALLLAVALYQIYVFAPIAAAITPFVDQGRWVGLLIAAIAFLAANLFTQVPVAVASVLLTGETAFASTIPLSFEEIQQRFTVFGFPVQKILPDLVVPERKIAIAPPSDPDSPQPDVASQQSPETDDAWTDNLDPAAAEEAATEPAAIAPVEAEGSGVQETMDAVMPDVVETVASVAIESTAIELAETEATAIESVTSASIEITESVEFIELSASDEAESSDEHESVVSESAVVTELDPGNVSETGNTPEPDSALEPDSQLDSEPTTIAAEAITTEEAVTEEITADDAPHNDL